MDYMRMNRVLLETFKRGLEKNINIREVSSENYIATFIVDTYITFEFTCEIPNKIEIYEDSDGVVVLGIPLGKIPVKAYLSPEKSYYNSAYFGRIVNSLHRFVMPEKSMKFVSEYRKYSDNSVDKRDIINAIGKISNELGGVDLSLELTLRKEYYQKNIRRDILPLVVFDFKKGEVVTLRDGKLFPMEIKNLVSTLDYKILLNSSKFRVIPFNLLDSEVELSLPKHEIYYKGRVNFDRGVKL